MNLDTRILSSSIQDLNNDSICFVAFESHCYVALYYENQNFAYVADGQNMFACSVDKSTQVRALLGITRIRPVMFSQQAKVDFCGSSAVMIALEFVRWYRLGSMTKTIFCPTSWRAQIVGELHKFPSAPVPLPPLHLRERIQDVPVEELNTDPGPR